MLCPKCKIEASIADARYVTVGDDSPEVETELYLEQDMKCRNPQCSDYSKVISTVRNKIQLSKGIL